MAISKIYLDTIPEYGKMEKYEIIPQSLILTDREAQSSEDAMINFAETMDSDMNAYVKAVHEDDATNELVSLIVKTIESSTLNADQCSKIYKALKDKA